MGIKKEMDKLFGSPGEAMKSIKELSDSVAALDTAKLKELRGILAAVGGVQVGPEEIKLIVEMVKIICAVDIEKVKEFRQLIVNLTQLVKLLPRDIPIGEILQTVREEFAGKQESSR